jgi:hypothetical protein
VGRDAQISPGLDDRALKELTAADEARVVALVRKAVS